MHVEKCMYQYQYRTIQKYTVDTDRPDYDHTPQLKKSLDGDRPAHSFSQSFSMTVWLINLDYYVDYYVDLLAHMYYGKSSV